MCSIQCSRVASHHTDVARLYLVSWLNSSTQYCTQKGHIATAISTEHAAVLVPTPASLGLTFPSSERPFGSAWRARSLGLDSASNPIPRARHCNNWFFYLTVKIASNVNAVPCLYVPHQSRESHSLPIPIGDCAHCTTNPCRTAILSSLTRASISGAVVQYAPSRTTRCRFVEEGTTITMSAYLLVCQKFRDLGVRTHVAYVKN